ncbi:MAG TPA: hypothetical protein VGQ83_06655 [Polyangia bacterium]|jgi:mannose-6-phosphate isomerase-like protein (cupin superfamily)
MKNSRLRIALVLAATLAAAAAGVALWARPAAAQHGDQPMIQPLGNNKFGGLPVLPTCMTFAVEHGNPTTGPSTLLIKLSRGCVLPSHWHTYKEELMFVSGTAKLEMPGVPTQPVTAGGYTLLPAKHHHQLTCQSGDCMLFAAVAGPFDIHYIDKAGKEIPAPQALQAVGEQPWSGAAK